MSNVVPFIAGTVDFDAVSEIRRQSQAERNDRIKYRLRTLADVFPASVKVLSLNCNELAALLAETLHGDQNDAAEFLAAYTAAARHARAVVAMVEDARLRVAAVLNVPIYEDDEEDDGDDDAA